MKRLVIYTCVTGGYDSLPEPQVLCADADYVCFSSEPVASSVWEWRPIQHFCRTNVLTARWHKLHPEELFQEYEYSLWMDGNVTVASSDFYDIVLGKIAAGVDYAGIAHPFRDDVYEEAYAVLSARKESLFRLLRICCFLKRHGVVRHAGLQETNVMLRRHMDENVMKADSLWWNLMVRYTHRDQLCQTWALLQTGIKPELLIPAGSTARNHPSLSYIAHDKAYVKDRSVRSVCQDALCAARKTIFTLFLRFI